MTKTMTTRLPLALCTLLIGCALTACSAEDGDHADHDHSTHEQGEDHDDHADEHK